LKMIRYILTIAIFLLFTTLAHAEDLNNGLRFGVLGGYTQSEHYSSFSKLPSTTSCCPEFNRGSGNSMYWGFMLEVPVWDKLFINLKGTWGEIPGDFISEETEEINIDGTPEMGRFEYRMSAAMPAFTLSPSINYNFFDRFSLGAGVSAAFLQTATFDQAEYLTDPPDRGVFSDNGKRVRNPVDGTIEGLAATAYALDLSIQYKLPLNRKRDLFLMPEFSYAIGLNDILKDSVWKIDQYKIGIAVVIMPGGGIEEVRERIEEIDTVFRKEIEPKLAYKKGIISLDIDTVETRDEIRIIEKYARIDTVIRKQEVLLSADVHAFGLRDGKEENISKIINEEFHATRMKPLLNYVFFDEGSDKINSNYESVSNKEEFSTDIFFSESTLKAYYNILNIVAYRLKQNPRATISLKGCISQNTGETLDLGNRRAGEVKKYITSEWNIDTQRILIQTCEGLPELPSNIEKTEGNEENRRVEIYSDSWEILQPIVSNDTLRISDPPVLRFYPAAESDAGIDSWKLIVKNYRTNQELNIALNAEFIPEQLDWVVDSDFISHADTLYYFIEVTDRLGAKAYSEIKPILLENITIAYKVENKTEDLRYDDFSLILFDFDKSELGENNIKISDFIKSFVEEDSRIEITGYTDSMGDEEHNLNLSKARADAVAGEIGNKNTDSDGVGEEIELYPNDTPEGRFYSRTVEIKIVTPIKK
jgi:outer membrane protein OmpA-like peptidoglycan-associated protein